jgi:integrase
MRKADAQRWLDEVSASIVTGQYVAPKAGQITLRDFTEPWRLAQVHRPATAALYEHTLRCHIYPSLGPRRLDSITPTDVQALIKRLSLTLAPSTVSVTHGILTTVLKAAVADRRIVSSPAVGTRLPKITRPHVVPLATAQVQTLAELAPSHIRGLILTAAGTGMRQGELFGVTVDHVHFLRRSLTVDRQLVNADNGRPVFGPPKTAASVREIPLPQVVVDALTAHLNAFPAGPHGLVFVGTLGQPHSRSSFWKPWRTLTERAGVPGFKFHGLRHYYASLLIRHGESVKTVQARLGHATAAETLDTYSHLWPDSDDRTRDAVDVVLGSAADSLRTEEAAR